MDRTEFREVLKERIVILDGATGSNLQKRGMPSGVCVEQWVCEHEDVLIELQKEYLEAGSDVVYASTFAVNRIKLKEFGLESQVAQMNKQLVGISRKAVGDQALVAGDITMTGQQLEPLGTVKFEELIDAYKEQMGALEEGGADFLVVETMMSLQETRAALIAAKETVSLPVVATMSFGEDGRTLYGTDAKTAAIVLEGLGADAVGVNCSAGPDKVLSVIRDMRSVTSLPIVAKPNAGLPKMGADGMTEYDMTKEEFVPHMKKLVDAGATVLGGCCGTNPEYIRAITDAVEQWKVAVVIPEQEDHIYLTSERNTVEWSEETNIRMISTLEDEELAEDFADGIYDTLYDFIDECDDDGAEVICLCVDGVAGDRVALMRNVIQEATSYSALPFIFQSDDVQVLEAALRAYPGRSAVRFAGEDKTQAEVLADKYGAGMIKIE